MNAIKQNNDEQKSNQNNHERENDVETQKLVCYQKPSHRILANKSVVVSLKLAKPQCHMLNKLNCIQKSFQKIQKKIQKLLVQIDNSQVLKAGRIKL